MGHLALDCPNRGARDDPRINLRRAFGSLVGMTKNGDVPSQDLTTTSQQEIVQYLDSNMSLVSHVIWLILWVFVEQFLFLWCHRPALSSANHDCSVRIQPDQSQFHFLQRTPRTVQITENGKNSTQIFHSSTVCSNLNRLMKITSFRQCAQYPTPSVGVFAEWAACAVEDVKGYALLDTGASRSVGIYT